MDHHLTPQNDDADTYLNVGTHLSILYSWSVRPFGWKFEHLGHRGSLYSWTFARV